MEACPSPSFLDPLPPGPDNSSVVTRHGRMFTLDTAAVEKLELLITQAENIIAESKVHVARDPDLVAEEKAREEAQRALHAKLKAAGQNVELRGFLAKVIPLQMPNRS